MNLKADICDTNSNIIVLQFQAFLASLFFPTAPPSELDDHKKGSQAGFYPNITFFFAVPLGYVVACGVSA